MAQALGFRFLQILTLAQGPLMVQCADEKDLFGQLLNIA